MMTAAKSPRTGFLLLILSQALHSVEEFYFSLWEVLAPARMVSGLVSEDLPFGFAVVNSTVVLFGLWCYLFPVRRSAPGARVIMWIWVVVELGNCIGHTLLAIGANGYFPGLYTTPALFVASCFVGVALVQNQKVRVARNEV